MKTQKLFTGPGCIESIYEHLSINYPSAKILFLCARSMSIYPNVIAVKRSIAGEFSVAEIVFSALYLTQEDVNAEIARVKDEMGALPEVLIVFGGGTVIDLAKCIKASLNDKVQILAIPTTAGTGAEATPFATVFENNKKKSLESPNLIPDVVFLDPNLLVSVPMPTAVACILDTIAQATESLWSAYATEESKKNAEKSLRLALEVWQDSLFSRDLIAIEKMQMASYLSGCAIAVSKTTLAHALSYRLTSQYKVSHGVAVFLNLAVVARFNAEMLLENPHSGTSKVMEIYEAKDGVELEGKIQSILENCGLSPSLISYGIKTPEEFGELIAEALANPRAGNNPRAVLSTEQLLSYYIQSGVL